MGQSIPPQPILGIPLASSPPFPPTVFPLLDTQCSLSRTLPRQLEAFLWKRCCGHFRHCCYCGWGCRTPFAIFGDSSPASSWPNQSALPHPEPQASFMCSKWSLASPTDFGCGPSSAKTSWGAEHSRKTWATICLYSTWLSQRLWRLRMLLACLFVVQILSSSLLYMHECFSLSSFADEGSCMLLKCWKNNCPFLASANKSLVMSVPNHSWSGLFNI